MNLNVFESLTDSDRDTLAKVVKTIKKEHASMRAYKSRMDSVCLAYQQQVNALSKECEDLKQASNSSIDQSWLELKLAEARKETQERYGSQITKLGGDLTIAQATVKSLATEKDSTDKALCSAREAAAGDAILLQQLQEEITQLRDSRERTASDSVEKHTRNMQLMQEAKDADYKVTQYQEGNIFLKSEVKRISTQLAQTRTQMDSMSVSHNAEISSANRMNTELSKNLAVSKTQVEKLTASLSAMEKHIIDLKSSFENEKSEHQTEIENGLKLVEMHSKVAKDAELRVSEYKELLAIVAKETNDARERPPDNAPLPLDLHAEVLFKTLNETLETKLQVLENERHELIKARANEARMATRQQALLREAESSKAEAEEARRQMAILEAELNVQKDKVAQLQRKLTFNGSVGGFQSPSVLPVAEGTESGFMTGTPDSVAKRRSSAQMQSPFLRGLSMGVAERALANMMDIRRQHESLLEQLKRQEDM
ncbi:unnamed protein product [Chondrus crispus]|uniref:Uncharacterized protein n=1 Tax=Chondrus crispus TaxID=2769 RepID=R7QQA9_CHOCR|nr:unnamed protein product [Chondrus crispus]CDF39555.1 unnamed protein product [Chondrus crispus]|eukprot:XP_005709849.1 unnamed protein product [Chondrus crispus]